MKMPGLLEGITLAIGASLGGGLLAILLPTVLSQSTGLRLIISTLGLAYLVYLLKRSNERTGRVVMVGFWLVATLACILVDSSLLSFLLVQTALIWVIRSLYFHASVLPALLDLGLICLALLASAWSLLQTGSVMTAIWCFFLTQSLFVLIPDFASDRGKASSSNLAEADRFQTAHRVALDAVRKLSTH